MSKNTILIILALALAAFTAGRWSTSNTKVKADSSESPSISVQAIRGDSSLTLYYPSLNKLFVYQSPFVGMPTWGRSYSVQLSTPGGKIERQPCSNAGQQF
jgi:hypothetical protein